MSLDDRDDILCEAYPLLIDRFFQDVELFASVLFVFIVGFNLWLVLCRNLVLVPYCLELTVLFLLRLFNSNDSLALGFVLFFFLNLIESGLDINRSKFFDR